MIDLIEIADIELDTRPDMGEDIQISTFISAETKFLNDMSSIPMLTREEEVELGHCIKKGASAAEALALEPDQPDREELEEVIRLGNDARNRLVEANLRLVVSIARKSVGRGVSLMDLIQEGNIGLMTAANNFDCDMGWKFSTYADWWIKQAIDRSLINNSRQIRLPATIHESVSRIYRIFRQMEKVLGREPTSKEVAEEILAPVDVVEVLLATGRPCIELDASAGGEDTVPLVELIPDPAYVNPEDAAINSSIRESIAEILSHLSEREQAVIRMRFGFDNGICYTFDEIGEILGGFSREYAAQTLTAALYKLKHRPNLSKKIMNCL